MLNPLSIQSKITPALDPGFMPASLWNRRYRELARQSSGMREVRFTITRPTGEAWSFDTIMLPDTPQNAEINWLYAERLVKFLLWAWGGSCIYINGAREITAMLRQTYCADGKRAFDHEFMGNTCFGEALSIEIGEAPANHGTSSKPSNARKLDGCRIGFDLGGSDRKCAALIDGEVVYSEEVKWDPYFQEDPAYHLAGIRDSLQLAAKHLPRVDAIGGSAAGIYIANEPRVASLFRGVNPENFDRSIRGIFKQLADEWQVPLVVANDGDVTALAGSMSLGDNAVLGISMGTSLAAGYVDTQGEVLGWLNELAFAPIDYRINAPIDEWSGDGGCGVQYFSQQAVARLIPASGLDIDDHLKLPEKLEAVQAAMKTGDERAANIYDTIGVYFGYALAHYADFYDYRHILFLGRVSSGEGGQRLLDKSQHVLEQEHPELAAQIKISTPDEKMKRHGQAIAAASLPTIQA
ncbi:ROK family protein [Cerasicoccus fimbriatus]|uniref:ROK family protein n=1 Tax=Cerasicoccus fimbriatus TaxID=3014554 RepID=UPI0022B4D1D3|nr:ROK family protein [Cerasicoccus sp. TK19100]